MTVSDALAIAYKSFMRNVDENDKRTGWHATSCLDFGDSYGFMFQPEGVELLGIGYQCVRKDNGKVYFFAPQLDMKKFSSATYVSLKETIGTDLR